MNNKGLMKDTGKKNKTSVKEKKEDEQIRLELCKNPPVDFSYKKVKSLKDFEKELPRAFRVKRVPDRGPNNRFLTCSIWLSNNRIMEMNDLKSFICKTLEQPYLLGWLDLSSNYLDRVPSELTEFPNLRILYLHGNIIEKLVYVKRLIPIKKLYSLTMHGNPIEDDIHYKNYILHFLPQLKTLDFISVLSCERKIPPPPPAVLAEEEPLVFTGTEEEMLNLLNEMKS